MKLYNVYYICKNLIEIFQENRIREKKSNQEYYINNWNEYKNALQVLHQIPIFADLSDEIYELIPVFVRERERPVIDANTSSSFINKNDHIVNKMRTIIEIYDSMQLEENQKGVDVKIPRCNELKEYIWYLKEIDFIFSQCPYLLCDNEKLHFSNVDVGSNWISFAIELTAGSASVCYIINNIAKILDKAIILKSHYLSVRQQEEALKSEKEKGELIDEEKQIFDTLRKHYMNEAVFQLEEEISPLENGEEKGKVEKSLEKLMTLLDKGVEIYASLDTPKDIQVLFPEIGETKKLPADVLKYLEDKGENDTE